MAAAPTMTLTCLTRGATSAAEREGQEKQNKKRFSRSQRTSCLRVEAGKHFRGGGVAFHATGDGGRGVTQGRYVVRMRKHYYT